MQKVKKRTKESRLGCSAYRIDAEGATFFKKKMEHFKFVWAALELRQTRLPCGNTQLRRITFDIAHAQSIDTPGHNRWCIAAKTENVHCQGLSQQLQT